jgi:hypothetical protein
LYVVKDIAARHSLRRSPKEATKGNGAVVFGIAVCLALCLCRFFVAFFDKVQDDDSPASTHSDSDGKREVQPAPALPNGEEATTLLQEFSEPATHADAVLTVDQSSETASLLGDSTQAPASDGVATRAPAQEREVKPSGSDAIVSESVEVVVVAEPLASGSAEESAAGESAAAALKRSNSSPS